MLLPTHTTQTNNQQIPTLIDNNNTWNYINIFTTSTTFCYLMIITWLIKNCNCIIKHLHLNKFEFEFDFNSLIIFLCKRNDFYIFILNILNDFVFLDNNNDAILIQNIMHLDILDWHLQYWINHNKFSIYNCKLLHVTTILLFPFQYRSSKGIH